MTEVAGPTAEGEDEEVVGLLDAVDEDHAAVRLDVPDLAEADTDVGTVAQDAAQRLGDLGSGKTCGRDLVEQRLEQVVVLTVDQEHIRPRIAELLAERQSRETAAVPIPGWFAAVEVYQPATLNATMNKIVDAYNREAPAERKLAFKQENIDGRLWYSVTFSGLGLQWTFDRGYWIVSMDRAVALRAIATRSNGFPLVRSSQFRAQLPSSAGLHRSGFAWFNLGPASSMLSSLTSSPQLQKLLAVRDASLITFNGETERIQVASRTRFTSLMLDTMLQAHMTGKRAK
jgi:hypothetical protein